MINRSAGLGSDMDKISLYKKLISEKNISELQWMDLIGRTSGLGSDMDKTNLLIEIAQTMPQTEVLRAACLKAAKSIGNDGDYGRAVRAIQ